MTEDEAIKEMKKIERIVSKVNKAGYSVDIIEGEYIVLTSKSLAKKRDERIDNIHYYSKEGAFRDDESIYSFTL